MTTTRVVTADSPVHAARSRSQLAVWGNSSGPPAYAGAHLLARMFVDGGETVVLECTYARRDQRASLLEAMAGSAAPLRVVEFFVTPDEAVSRFRERPQATDLDEALVRERAEAFPYFHDALRIESSSGSPEDHAQSIVT
ncbi:AAA family ATPase [Micromonospora parva]|uniref:AAA family ATPase n=1 Tax=Micromonospora parva TaxID=1464048 RepID=UPI0033C5993F